MEASNNIITGDKLTILDEIYVVEQGEGVSVQMVCFDKSEKYAYLCPVSKLDNGDVLLHVGNTQVYSLAEGDTPIELVVTALIKL